MKLPKFSVKPLFQTKEDKKKAKLLTELLNYQFDNNVNGCRTKFLNQVRAFENKLLKEKMNELRTGWDTMERCVDKTK
jgi:hypothetical protein